MWNLKLIMMLLVLSIGSVQYVMDPLEDVMNSLNEDASPFNFELDMRRICLSSCKWYGYINVTKWLECQPHLKGAVSSQGMESFVIAMLDIGEAFIPCVFMLRVLHEKDLHDHPIDDLCLTISLGVEGHGISEIGIQHRLEA